MVQVLREAGVDRQLALIRAHPELAGKAMVAKTLTSESTNEQGKAGLTDCTPEEFARIQQLNTDYNARFGFPFILAVRGAARHRAHAPRDHRDLRAPAGEPARVRARRGAAQHPTGWWSCG
jgi:OHCU decarboxylase